MGLLTENIYDLKNQIKKGMITPAGKINTDVEIKDNGMIIRCLDELNLDAPVCVYFYDKKNEKCIAIGETVTEENTITVKFTDVVLNALSLIEFKYARVCVAVKTNNKYSSFYVSVPEEVIMKNNKPDYALGVIEGSSNTLSCILLYFSVAGLLSIKINGYDKDVILSRVINNMSVKSICCEEDCIVVEREYEGNDYLDRGAKLAFENDKDVFVFDEIFREYDSENNITKIVSSFSFEKINSFGIMNFSYRLAESGKTVFIKNDNLLSGFSFNRDFKVYSNDVEKTIVFTKENHQLMMTVYRKYYNSAIAVIMAVYNTEHFVSEAIESVLAQKTDKIKMAIEKAKEENVFYKSVYELILVDDGSDDSSGEICERYADAYPQITVIHKENGGVSSARNLGIKASNAKYLNFMDSDDKFSDNVFEECFTYFENHYDEVTLVTFPLKFFDAKNGDHWLNDKFEKGTRIINLNNEYDKSVVSTCSALFKSEKIYGNLSFNTDYINGEDIDFIYRYFLLTSTKIGVITKCIYWYRRRSEGESSAIQNSIMEKSYYSTRLSTFSGLIEEYQKKFGETPLFVQNLVMQQLQWILLSDEKGEIARSVISDDEYTEYKNRIKDLLNSIDNQIVLKQKKIFREHKVYVCSFKEDNYCVEHTDNDIVYKSNDTTICIASTSSTAVDFLDIKNDVLIIEGSFTSFENDSDFYIRINDEYILLDKIEDENLNKYVLSDISMYGYRFKLNYHLDNTCEKYTVGLFEKHNNTFIKKKQFRMTKFMPIVKTFSKAYFLRDNWITNLVDNEFVIKNINYSIDNIGLVNKYEAEFIKQLEEKAKKEAKYTHALEFRKKAFPLIMNYKAQIKKKIWLICDRSNMAGDNGEALFLYLTELNDPEISVYFVIDKKSDDYDRLSKFGNVVALNSFQHLLLHMLADCVISSMSEDYIFNPFSAFSTTDAVRDLVFDNKYIFLQHGITKDDVSNLFNKYTKNMSGFITSAYPEKQSILDYDYYYTEDQVWLTGFPRYDRLYHDEKRIITVMPTWRKNLAKHPEDSIFRLTVIDDFEDTPYFKFYNALLNNEKLLSAAEKYNYKFSFMAHPNLRDGNVLFDHDSRVLFYDDSKTYRELFAECNLIVTDYSSTAMDFAYLRKPVLYSHFDKEEFFENHTYSEGYFDYERDGFGEVTYDMEKLVDTIIEYMKNECELKDIYRERIDKFFAFDDKNNCERVYRKIKKLCEKE